MKKIFIFLISISIIFSQDIFIEDENYSTDEIENQTENRAEFLNALQLSFFDRNDPKNLLPPVSKNIYNIKYKQNRTYKIRTRLDMNSLFILDKDKIAYFLLGDERGFEAKLLGAGKYDLSNMIVIKPQLAGIDTSLTIIGESGNIYSFYLFSTNHENIYNPKLIIFISEDVTKIRKIKIRNLEKEAMLKVQIQKEAILKINEKSIKIEKDNYLTIGEGKNRLKIDKNEIIRGYTQNASKNGKNLMAYDIFRDKKFTYFRYDKNNSLKRFPVIYRVVDGFDNPVNSKIVGDYIIAETSSNRFTLRIGDQYVCVRKIKND
ncbi:MAG: TrbG/VirB9 family P-type conjugative transfer protein [Sulfurospirillum sp.]|nr:TrbG/VirB9 family P-type conjugative transfer protein [Sulfurospirillum sp.]